MSDWRPRKVVRREEIEKLRQSGAEDCRAGYSRLHGTVKGLEFLDLQHWQDGWDLAEREIRDQQAERLRQQELAHVSSRREKRLEIAECLERVARLIRELEE